MPVGETVAVPTAALLPRLRMAGSRATVTPRHGPLGSLLLLAAQAALSLVSDALVPGSTLGDCAFGTEPGYWNRQKFVLFNASCALEPILDKVQHPLAC